MWLGSFVADGAPNFIYDLWWNFGHVVIFAGVLGTLLQNVLVSLPFATKSQSIPTSLQLTVFAMLSSSDGFFI